MFIARVRLLYLDAWSDVGTLASMVGLQGMIVDMVTMV